MPMAERIITAVANEFCMSAKDIMGPSQQKHVCLPRFVAMGIFLEMTPFSLRAIAKHVGRTDHTVVVNARKRIKPLFQEEAFRNRIEQIKAELAA
jgi:chromosomal replication initiation ATPase DnaA